MRSRRCTAFTIIELLTVMAILGLLMALLFPSLAASRRKAKANVCLTNLKSLDTAAQFYLHENRDYFFPVRMDKISPNATEDYVNFYNRKAPRWQWFVETDLGPVIDPKPFKRLGQPFDDDGLLLGGGEGRKMSNELFTCPSLDEPVYARDIRDGAYGYNYQYLGNTRTDTDEKRWDNFAVAMHTIKSPGQTVLFGDSRGAGIKHGRNSFMLDPPRLAKEVNAQRFGPSPSDVDISRHRDLLAYSPVEMRHDDTGNVAFTDGHAAPMTLRALGYEYNDPALGDVMPIVADLPRNLALPQTDIQDGPYEATNRLWNGLGRDDVHDAANDNLNGNG